MSKILIVGTAYPYRGGIAAFNERLARQFQEEGDEVEIWTFTLQYPNFLFPGKTQYSTDSAPESLNIKRVVNSVNPFNWLKVGRKINQGHYDKVVFAYWMSFFAPCYGMMARRIKTAQRIALIHNMMPHEGSLMDKWLTPYFVKSMDGFVALSQSVVGEVTRLDKKGKPYVEEDFRWGRYISHNEAARIQSMQELNYNGLSRGQKMKALGNAVNVDVVELIARRLIREA